VSSTYTIDAGMSSERGGTAYLRGGSIGRPADGEQNIAGIGLGVNKYQQ